MMAYYKIEDGKIEQIKSESLSLQDYQTIVGGHIELYPFCNAYIICNENGKLKGLKPTLYHIDSVTDQLIEVLVGTLILCDTNEEDICPIDDIKAKPIIDSLIPCKATFSGHEFPCFCYIED